MFDRLEHAIRTGNPLAVVLAAFAAGALVAALLIAVGVGLELALR